MTDTDYVPVKKAVKKIREIVAPDESKKE